MGQCKVNCSFRSVQQQVVWWSLHWELRPGWAADGLWGVRFCRFVGISRGGSTRQPQRTELFCQGVSGQPWACHGALQDQMQPLQFSEGEAEPALGTTAGLGRWFICSYAGLWKFPEEEAALGNRSAQSPASVV